MKKRILILSTFLLPLFLNGFGQTLTTGTVAYEEVLKIEIKIEGEMAAMMRDFPKERKSNKILYFNQQASLFEKAKSAESGDMESFGGHEGGMRMMMQEPENKVFIDIEKKEVLEQRDFMTRMFLIKTELPATSWKITGNQKKILDYPCMEAISEDTAGVVTKVWFTPNIPVSSGPGLFCNLPGLVLGVDVDNGTRTLLASSIDPTPPAKDNLQKPRDGKKVSQEEFDKIVAEKLKEMGVEGGPGGGSGAHVVIQIKH